MSSFEEYRKKLSSKYGTRPTKEDEEEEKKESKVDGSSVWDDSFESFRRNMNTKYGSDIDSKGVKSWFTDTENTIKGLSDYYKANDGKWVSDYGSDFTDSIAKLKSDAASVGYYLRNNKSEFADYSSLSKALSEYLSYLEEAEKQNTSMRDFYSQFGSENEYNTWYNHWSPINDPDYDKYVQAGQGVENPDWESAQAPLNIFGWKPLGDGEEVINMVAFAEANGLNAAKSSGAMNGGNQNPYDELVFLINGYMKPEEKERYNYYIGKGETEKANEYLTYMTEILKQRQAGKMTEQADNHLLLEPIMTTFAGMESGFTGLGNFVSGIKGTEGAKTSVLQYAHGQMSENNEGVWKTVNDLAYSTGNMVPSIGAGTLATMVAGPAVGKAVGSLVTGMSSAGNSYAEMIAQGYGVDQARKYGVMVGTAEAGLSYLFSGISSIGGKVTGNVINKAIDGIDNGLARFFVDFAISSSSEALEEGAQTILDPIFKMVATGEDFEGIDWSEVAYSAMLGGLSAGLLEGVPNGVRDIHSNYQTNVQMGGLSNKGAVNAFFKGTESGTKGFKGVAEAYKSGKQAVTESAGAYVNEALEIDPDNAHAQRMQARINDGKNVSGYQINRLVEANENALVSQDKGKIKATAEAQLTKLGETGNVAEIAEAIAKHRSGEKLTKAEQALIANSTYGRRVSNGLDPDNIMSGEYDTAWAENIGTERINTEGYNKGLYDLAVQTVDKRETAKKASVIENTPIKDKAIEAKYEASKDIVNQPVTTAVMLDNEGNEVEVKPQKFSTTESGQMGVEIEDGKVVAAAEVDFGDSDIGLVYQAAVDMSSMVGGFSVDTANVFVRGYDAASGQSAGAYIDGWVSAYKFGAMKNPPPLSALAANQKTARLTEEQRKTAYNFGRAFGNEKVVNTVSNNAENISKTDSKQKKGRVIFDGERYGKRLNERQRASLKALNFIAEALGINIYVDKLAKGDNGWYDPKDRSIHVSLEAGAEGEALMLYTTSHELSHDIRATLPEKFNTLADAVFEEYNKRFGEHTMADLIEAKINDLKDWGDITEDMTEEQAYDLAFEEVICDCLETMLVDSDAMMALSQNIYAKDKTLWQRIKDFFTRLVERIRAAYADAIPDSEEGQRFRDLGEGAERIKRLWEEAIVELSEVDKTTGEGKVKHSYSSIAYSFFGDENISIKDMESGAYKKTEGYKRYVDQCLNNMRQSVEGFSEKVALKEIRNSIDGIVEVAVAMKKAGYDILDTEGGRNIRDSKKRLLFSSLEPNSDYFTSSDISTICDKRINFAEIYDEIVRREDAMGVPKNKRFFNNIDNYFVLHKILADKGLTAPCRQCYVESMRKNLDPMANAFIELMQETDPNNKANKQLYQPSGKNKGELKSNNAKLRENLLEVIEREQYDITADKLTIKMLTTADGLAQLKLQAPLIYEAFNSFYGQSKPKMPKAATPFRFGELTALLTDDKGKIKTGLIKQIMSTGGFRLQSYSDFQIQNFADVLQVIFEAGTLGLNGHAYTKVPAFLDATKGTNLKRNISIFMYKDGGQWKIDRGDSFPLTLEEIYNIVDADESGNTGIIAVVQNEDMAAWVMANGNVGYFIPFHKSGVKMGVVRETIVREGGREIKGYSGIKDHTRQQTEVWAKTTADHKANTKVKKGINIYEFWDFDNAENLSQKELIRKNVEAYIDACNEAGYLPKFREYVMDNGKVLNKVLAYAKELGFVSQNATIDDISFEYSGYRIPYGYYKCLGDFGMFTPDGEASPVERLSLKDYNFNEAVKFFSDAETLRRNEILQQFENGFEREKYRNSDMTTAQLAEEVQKRRNQVVDEVVNGEYKKVKHSHTAPEKSDYVAKITADMTEEERYEALKKRSIDNILPSKAIPNSVLEKMPEISSWDDLNQYRGSVKKNLVRKLATEFKVLGKEYSNEDINLSFEFSRNNFDETYDKQKHNYVEFAKMFSVFDSVIDSAVGVEIHNRLDYKPDPTLENVFVLMSAYRDGEYLIPVKLEVKQFKDKQNTLYVAISLEKIKMTEVSGQGNTENGVTQSPRSVNISIAQIFGKINPSDKNFLKYIPDGFLDDKQKAAKQEALVEDADNAYMSAIKRNDMKAAQRMVDEAAKKAGYDVKAYHGSKNIFTVFDEAKRGSNTKTETSKRWFFAADEKTANSYYPYGALKEIYKQHPNWEWANPEKLKDSKRGKLYSLYLKLNNPLVVDVAGYDYASHRENADAWMEYVEQAESNGNDGIILLNAMDNQLNTSARESTVYMFRESSQVKSADPVTYDDDGNVIPLSERFNPKNSDIRYSHKADKKASYQHRNSNGMKPRTLLANALESAVAEEERNLLQTYKDNIDKLNAEQEKLEMVMEEADKIQFRKSLSISGEEMSVATFEKRAKAKAEKNGINAEDVQFKLDRSNAKYIAYAVGHGRILEADKTFRSAEDNAKLKELYAEAKEISSQINAYDRELLRLQAMQPIKEVLKREKAMAAKRATEKAEQRRKESVEKVRESAAKTEAKVKLQKLILKTSKWISYPGKDDVKCPDILRGPYAKFLEGIDLSSKRLLEGGEPTHNDERVANAMNNLANAIERITNAQDPSIDTDKVLDSGYLDLPVEFVGKLREMAENISKLMVGGDYVINRMSATDVKQLTKLIRTLNHAIKEMSTLYANLRFANVEALGDNSMSFLESMGEAKGENAVADFVAWDNVLPYYAFKRFGEGGESIFEGLMDGQDKLARLAEKIFDFKDKTWTDKEAKAWGEDTHTIALPSGNTLTLTTANAMGIYCLSRREQGLQHLLGGGTRVIGIKKGAKKATDSRSTLTQEDINAIVASLTDRQKKVALEIQKFMSSTCAEWGNEVSMKRFLTKEFTDPNYYPIESNDENLAAKDPQAQKSDLYRLLNISATKPLAPGANNEVIIRNIFDVFIEHSSDMAKLNAYGLALLDYMKWANYREKSANENGQIKVRGVHKAMTRTYGDKSWSYVLNLIKDVNGRYNDNGDNAFLMNMMRLQKTASVGSNLRVAFLQFTSYPRASLVLSNKSLALGLTKKPQMEKAKKYCGIALWKSYGFYDTNIARSIEDQLKGTTDIRQKLIELSMKGPEYADAITWGALWNACEYEVAKTTKNKVGSEEFYQEVGLKLREVVYATQVVDSILTRSQIMRSKSGLTQTATAYMSEPTLTANILMDAGFQFQKEKRISGSAKEAWKKTGKVITKAVGNYLVLQLVTSIAESLADAWRDDDEEEFLKKFGEAFGENLITNLIPFNKIPIISDIADLLLSFFGVGYVSSDNLSTTWLTQAANAVKAWSEVLGEAFGDKEDENYKETSKTVYNAIYQTAKVMSSLTGVSVSGAMREVVAIWNNTAGAADPSLKIRQYELTGEEKRKALYEAMTSGNEKQIAWLEEGYETQTAIDSAIRKALRDNDPRIKEAAEAKYNGDIAEYTKIAKEIIAEGHFKQDDVVAAINSEISALEKAEGETSTSTPSDKEVSLYGISDYYSAITRGESATANAVREDLIETAVANGKDREEAEESFNSSFRNYIGKMYKGGEIGRDKASDMLISYGGYDTDEAYWKMKEWDFRIENGEDASYSKYNDFYDAVKTGSNLKAVISEYTSHGVETKTLASQITTYFKPLYMEMTNSERAKLKGYLLNAYVLLGYKRSEKSKDIDKWLK